MTDVAQTFSIRQVSGLVLGPALFALLLLLPVPDGMTPAGMNVAATATLMACWWVTEAIPIPATALLPIALFPVLGVMKAPDATASYANHLIFLFMGGFLIAVTIEKWNLHKRIALHTVRLIGITPDRIVLGFMIATAFLSMWISNTATAMMMMTIGLAVIRATMALLEERGRLDAGYRLRGIDRRGCDADWHAPECDTGRRAGKKLWHQYRFRPMDDICAPAIRHNAGVDVGLLGACCVPQ